jgi:hypothetical protein
MDYFLSSHHYKGCLLDHRITSRKIQNKRNQKVLVSQPHVRKPNSPNPLNLILIFLCNKVAAKPMFNSHLILVGQRLLGCHINNSIKLQGSTNLYSSTFNFLFCGG